MGPRGRALAQEQVRRISNEYRRPTQYVSRSGTAAISVCQEDAARAYSSGGGSLGALSDKKLGAKFRRQHPFGRFILDFYCHEKKLAIEIDGGYHLDEAQQQYDALRTEYLREMGVREIRFSNEERRRCRWMRCWKK